MLKQTAPTALYQRVAFTVATDDTPRKITKCNQPPRDRFFQHRRTTQFQSSYLHDAGPSPTKLLSTTHDLNDRRAKKTSIIIPPYSRLGANRTFSFFLLLKSFFSKINFFVSA
jgi:hypothetical protein